MAFAAPSIPARQRGAIAAHDDDALLDLAAAVARAAVQDSARALLVAERISVRMFNAAKLDVDRARGLADPLKDPQRTPTAAAIIMRFNVGYTRSVAWQEIVTAALRPDRSMWLAAVRRADPVEPVAAGQLIFALRFIAVRLGTSTLSRRRYHDKREGLVAEDVAHHGDDALLPGLLPTLNQIDGQLRWKDALKLAGLAQPQAANGARLGLARQAAGLPAAQAMALYAAVNDTWASRVTLQAFAIDSRFALASRKGADWKLVVADARVLLEREGVPVPVGDAPKAMGRGKRLSYRYPVNGVPGAPVPSHLRRHSTALVDQQSDSDEPARHRELCITGLRVWVASLNTRDKRTCAAFATWRAGKGWPSQSKFARHGGFGALKAEAAAANDRDLSANGEPVPHDLLRRADQVKRELDDALLARLAGNAPQDAAKSEPRPFGEMLRAAAAGPHAVGQPPKQ